MLITAVDSFLLLLIERLGIRNLEAVFGVMIAVMAVSFGFMAELAQVSFPSIAKGAAGPPACMPKFCLICRSHVCLALPCSCLDALALLLSRSAISCWCLVLQGSLCPA